jgi:hypothetical protein
VRCICRRIAGIDQALWDIKGKAYGQPIHALLGGQVRDRIKVYSWIGGDRPADVANNAREVVARGFKAIKLNGAEEMQIVDTLGQDRDAIVADDRHRARRGGASHRHRRGFPRPGAPADGQGAGQGARTVQADVHRGAGALGKPGGL